MGLVSFCSSWTLDILCFFFRLWLTFLLLIILVFSTARDADGRTALHYAAREGHGPVVQALLVHGANVNAEDHEGLIPLYLAASREHWEWSPSY
jgi:hypothetical protein